MAATTSFFWFERVCLTFTLYCMVEGKKEYFAPMLFYLLISGLISFTFIFFDVGSFFSTLSNPQTPGDRSGVKGVIKKKTDGEDSIESLLRVCDACEARLVQELSKAKEKYKEDYEQKLKAKEEKLKKDKSLLKDKYNEDREKWEEERKCLKQRYEEMRWN